MIRLADRFVLGDQLGSGGMATVFLGRDEVLDRAVAVKLLDPVHGGTDIGDRFEREGRTAARLAHPNIVQVYDAGEAEFNGKQTSYIVMEYVSGGDLKQLIDERGPLQASELAGLCDEVCAGLTHAHEHGVIHRDIKPHNILLDEKGHAKVTDFGIARALDTTQATRTGSFLGTALYSSPEQLQGHKVTPKSDVYSLGATLYQAAAGEPPFTGATPIEIASQHVSKTPVPPRELGADVSEGMQALILDCLAKNPDDRPTAAGARSRLETEIAATGATQAQPAVAAVAAAATTRPEQTRDAPAPPPPGASPGGSARREGGGRRGGLLAVLAVLAVLLVIGALAAPNLLGGGGGESAGSNNSGENNSQSGGNEGGSNSGSNSGSNAGSGGDGGSQGTGGGQTPSPSASASAEPSASASGSSTEEQNTPEQGEFTPQAANATVENFYTTTSEGEYDRSARLLSQDWRNSTFPNRGVFEGTFNKVQRVEFIQGPSAEVSGDTATVTGKTRATLDGEVQQNQGTWYLVKEDGRWKIDSWDVVPLSSRPA